jgi:hypothetical protein
MNSIYVDRQLTYVDFVFSEIDKWSLDPFIESLIAQYLAALICGIYEDAIEQILDEFIQKTSTTMEIKNFISNSVSNSFRNPDQTNIKRLLKLFNDQWGAQLDRKLQTNNWEALDAIILHKNHIAHGTRSNITYPQIKRLFQDSKKIIEEIDLMIL